MAAGFQLLCGAGADKADTGCGVILLQQAGSQHHGGHGHADAVSKLGEVLLGHNAPCRAAGGSHERVLGGNFLQEVMRFINGAQVSTDGNFCSVGKAQALHGLAQFGGGHVGELVDKGRCHDGDDFISALDGLDQLEDLALIHDSAERAVDQAHTTGYALVVINICAAMLVRTNSTNAASLGAGALHLDDGVVRAGGYAAAALDAEILINVTAAIAEADCLFGADLLAGVSQAPLAHAGNLYDLFRALVTGKLDNVDQRRLIVLVSNYAVLQVFGSGNALGNRAQRKAHSQTDAFRNNRSLQEDAAAQRRVLAGHDLKGQVPDFLRVICHFIALIGHAGNFGKYLAPNVGYRGINASHCAYAPYTKLLIGRMCKAAVRPRTRTFAGCAPQWKLLFSML